MKATYMLFTGCPISAQEAYSSGLVTTVVPSEQLDAEVDRICMAIKAKSRAVVALGKKFYYEQILMSVSYAYQYGEQVCFSGFSFNLKSIIEHTL